MQETNPEQRRRSSNIQNLSKGGAAGDTEKDDQEVEKRAQRQEYFREGRQSTLQNATEKSNKAMIEKCSLATWKT